MEKTNEKSKKISEIIKELEQWKNSEGDMEVIIANTNESCFDGVGKMFVMLNVSNNEKFLGIIRSNVVIKI
jgi:wobble nucleotide-excising tRNase